jgi:hypothetical protein
MKGCCVEKVERERSLIEETARWERRKDRRKKGCHNNLKKLRNWGSFGWILL